MTKNNFEGFFGGLTSYGDEGFSRFIRQVFLNSLGYTEEDFDKPVIGIADTSSGFVTCHKDMPQLIESIKRGISEAGGLPVVFPTMSLPEIMINPTSMYLRNLMAMETEELIRTQPMDGVVLVGGCDKSVPAQIMAGISAGKPFMQVVAGPMVPGRWNNKKVGACTDCRSAWSDFRGGRISDAELSDVGKNLVPTGGTCTVMGTASTMACISEVLGFSIAGSATPSAPSGERLSIGAKTGRAIVAATLNQLTPQKLLTKESFQNAALVLGAIGGSTNAIVHLLAIAKRANIEFKLADIEKHSNKVPVIVNCKPSGSGYMDDFHSEGGVPQLLHQVKENFNLNTLTMTGKTWRDILESIEYREPSGIGLKTIKNPVTSNGGLKILFGNLAPNGCVIKVSAATPKLCQHIGNAVVFESIEDMMQRIDDPNLDVSENSVLVLKNAGPVGAAMPEAGALPIPKKLAAKGVKDMVRISDARMSGTAFGTVVLHISPEASVGGMLSIVNDGDLIELDVDNGRIELLVDPQIIETRLTEMDKHSSIPQTKWGILFKSSVGQASEGMDLEEGIYKNE